MKDLRAVRLDWWPVRLAGQDFLRCKGNKKVIPILIEMNFWCPDQVPGPKVLGHAKDRLRASSEFQILADVCLDTLFLTLVAQAIAHLHVQVVSLRRLVRQNVRIAHTDLF